jgi:hypothetical protein
MHPSRAAPPPRLEPPPTVESLAPDDLAGHARAAAARGSRGLLPRALVDVTVLRVRGLAGGGGGAQKKKGRAGAEPKSGAFVRVTQNGHRRGGGRARNAATVRSTAGGDGRTATVGERPGSDSAGASWDDGSEVFRVSVPTSFATGSGADEDAATRDAAIATAGVTLAVYRDDGRANAHHSPSEPNGTFVGEATVKWAQLLTAKPTELMLVLTQGGPAARLDQPKGEIAIRVAAYAICELHVLQARGLPRVDDGARGRVAPYAYASVREEGRGARAAGMVRCVANGESRDSGIGARSRVNALANRRCASRRPRWRAAFEVALPLDVLRREHGGGRRCATRVDVFHDGGDGGRPLLLGSAVLAGSRTTLCAALPSRGVFSLALRRPTGRGGGDAPASSGDDGVAQQAIGDDAGLVDVAVGVSDFPLLARFGIRGFEGLGFGGDIECVP